MSSHWFRPREHLFMLFFCLVWDSVLLAVFGRAFIKGELAQARRLEHALELHLDINDRPVPDEAPNS